jgi:hypothetical protein
MARTDLRTKSTSTSVAYLNKASVDRSLPPHNNNALFQLGQHLSDVGLMGESNHDVQFFHLHIYRIVVLDEEDLHLLLENVRTEIAQGAMSDLSRVDDGANRFWTIRLMLRNATYWISGSADRSVTMGGASFLIS